MTSKSLLYRQVAYFTLSRDDTLVYFEKPSLSSRYSLLSFTTLPRPLVGPVTHLNSHSFDIMQLSLLIAGSCLALAHGAAVDLFKRDTPLTVELTSLGDNSRVKAAVTNTDSRGYNLFYRGSFLDGDSPVDKFEVHGEASRAAFNGVLLRMATTNLEATQFVPILAGQTIETEIDVAELYGMLSSRFASASTDVHRCRDQRQLHSQSHWIDALRRTEQYQAVRKVSSILEQRSHDGHRWRSSESGPICCP